MAATLGLVKYLQDQRAEDQMARGYDKQRWAISKALQSGADPYEAAYQNMPKKSGGISMPGLSNFLVNMGGAFNPGGLGGRIQKNFGPATQGRVAEESLNRQKADQLVNDMKLESVQKANLSQLAADPNITGVSTNKEGNVNLKFTTPKQVGEGQVLQNQMAAGGFNPMSALQQNQDITKQLQGMQGGTTEGASKAGEQVLQSTSPSGANAAQASMTPVPSMLPEPEQQTRLQALQGQAPAQAAPTMEDYAQMMQEQGYDMPEVSKVLGSNPSISSGEQAATPEPSMMSRILGSIGPSEAQAGGRQRKIGEGFGLTAEQVLAIDKRAEEATSAPYEREYKKALIQQAQQAARNKDRIVNHPVVMPDGTTKMIPFTVKEWIDYNKGIWAAQNAKQRNQLLTPLQDLRRPYYDATNLKADTDRQKADLELRKAQDESRLLSELTNTFAQNPGKSLQQLLQEKKITMEHVRVGKLESKLLPSASTSEKQDPRVNQAIAEYRGLIKSYTDSPVERAQFQKDHPGQTPEQVALDEVEKRFPGVGRSIITTGKVPQGKEENVSTGTPKALGGAPAEAQQKLPKGVPPGSTAHKDDKGQEMIGPRGGRVYWTGKKLPNGQKELLEVW